MSEGKGSGKASGKRPYRMRARARLAAATGTKILDAGEQILDERPLEDFTLSAVAERSGVTVQTVVRRFGSRNGLLMATVVHAGLKMRRDREAPVGDVAMAVDVLVDHYDQFGDRILRLLAAEEQSKAVRVFTDTGRTFHRHWCERIFAAALADRRGTARERRVAQLVAVTDIYTWKLLRRDRGLSGRQTKLAMRELLEPLMESPS